VKQLDKQLDQNSVDTKGSKEAPEFSNNELKLMKDAIYQQQLYQMQI
jgi:hypothetical protein